MSGLPRNLEVSLQVLRSAQKTEWYLLNAADFRSAGDAPAGSAAGCQLMGLDVLVRLQDCPDFDNVWGQPERPCVQGTSGVCDCRMAVWCCGALECEAPLQGQMFAGKHPWFMMRLYIATGHNFSTWVFFILKKVLLYPSSSSLSSSLILFLKMPVDYLIIKKKKVSLYLLFISGFFCFISIDFCSISNLWMYHINLHCSFSMIQMNVNVNVFARFRKYKQADMSQ